MTLLWFVKSRQRWSLVFEESPESAGEVALETAAGLSWGLALSDAPVDVVAGGGVGREPGAGDVVQGPVEVAVASAVEAV